MSVKDSSGVGKKSGIHHAKDSVDEVSRLRPKPPKPSTPKGNGNSKASGK